MSDRPVALVTGGGTGIGAACCRRLAAEGFRVAIHYRSSEEKAQKLAAELEDAFIVKADLMDSDSLDALASDLKTKAGPLTGQAGRVMTDARRMMSDVRKATKSLSEVTDLMEAVITENREPVRDFSTGGLYEITQFVSEARTLVNGLTRLSAQIERSPARFFFGDTQKGFRPN